MWSGSAVPALNDSPDAGAVTTVLVVASDAAARAAVTRVVATEPGLALAAETGAIERALFELRSLSPDVAVLVEQPGGDGVRQLVEGARSIPVLVLGTRADTASVGAALRAGARGYLLRDLRHGELADAIRELAAGGTYVDPALGAGLIAAEATARRREVEMPLSARELEVLRLLTLGYGNRDAARELLVSPRTVESHRARIMRKLGLSTRAELIAYALENGVIDGEA
jgi:two-component system response regulator NreC